MTKKQPSSRNSPKKRHKFFLNPYSDCGFTKCPKCDTKTKIRKYPLVIHVEPKQIFLLNKKCKYCVNCDLIIAKKQEIESFLALALSPQLRNKQSQQKRKEDTRRKILLGALMIEMIEQGELDEKKILKKLDVYLSKDIDRKLFALLVKN